MMSMLLAQKLYLRIWLALVAAVAVLALLVGLLWRMAIDEQRAQHLGRTEPNEIVLRNGAGQIVGRAPARAVRLPAQGLEFEVQMSNGQTMYVNLPRPRRVHHRMSEPSGMRFWLQSAYGFIWLLGLTAATVALGAYPVVRRLTQRLEALQKGVERWGDGDLSTRLPVQGHDEIAFLAVRFNAAAQRVQTLLQSHKSLLAHASHELRSPLTRIRMGLALMPQDDSERHAELARSIEEIDQLIDEILLASRLDMQDANDVLRLGPTEEIDLIGLAAEECARTGADLDIAPGIAPVLTRGHARLLRRLLRNLLENAQRHSAQSTESSPVAPVRLTMEEMAAPAAPKSAWGKPICKAERWLRLCVEDSGPGVPIEERERIFEPFYRLPTAASPEPQGTGLGLSLVKSIATHHGARVHCEARTGGGARFVLELPILA